MINRYALQNALRVSNSLKSINFILNNDNKSAGVLIIIFFLDEKPNVILTKRSSRLLLHSGEISFPGGKFLIQDSYIWKTALRETFEEIGILFTKDRIIGCLPKVKTFTTNYTIYPFVLIASEKEIESIKKNEEVDEIIFAPLETLLKTKETDSRYSNDGIKVFKYTFNKYIIWGATARILTELFDIIFS